VVSVARRGLLGLPLRLEELRGHRVERFGEHAELVLGRDRLAPREIAFGHRARALGETPERRREALGQHDREAKRRR
jgi:hypothetical protein